MGSNGSGPRNNNWKGGRSIASNGYILLRVGVDHHLADVRGYAYEHRVVAEKKIGRRLKKGEQVHHIDGDIKNNDPSNVQVVPSIAAHREAEGRRNPSRRVQGMENPLIQCACGCKVWRPKFDNFGRPRKFVSGHNAGDKNRKGTTQ